jgi:hypothetical protein
MPYVVASLSFNMFCSPREETMTGRFPTLPLPLKLPVSGLVGGLAMDGDAICLPSMWE